MSVSVAGFVALIARRSQTDARPVSHLVDTLLPETELDDDARTFFLRYGVVGYLNDRIHKYVQSANGVGHNGDDPAWYSDGASVARREIGVPKPLLVTIVMLDATGELVVNGLDATVADWSTDRDREKIQINAGRRRVHAIEKIIALLEGANVGRASELPSGGTELDAIVQRGWPKKLTRAVLATEPE